MLMVRREYQGQGIGKGLIDLIRERVSVMIIGISYHWNSTHRAGFKRRRQDCTVYNYRAQCEYSALMCMLFTTHSD